MLNLLCGPSLIPSQRRGSLLIFDDGGGNQSTPAVLPEWEKEEKLSCTYHALTIDRVLLRHQICFSHLPTCLIKTRGALSTDWLIGLSWKAGFVLWTHHWLDSSHPLPLLRPKTDASAFPKHHLVDSYGGGELRTQLSTTNFFLIHSAELDTTRVNVEEKFLFVLLQNVSFLALHNVNTSWHSPHLLVFPCHFLDRTSSYRKETVSGRRCDRKVDRSRHCLDCKVASPRQRSGMEILALIVTTSKVV